MEAPVRRHALTKAPLLFIAATAQLPGPVLAEPIALESVQGARCTALAPKGWAVTNESADSSGVDLASSDGQVIASYLIFAVAGVMQNNASPGMDFRSPELSMQTILQGFGQYPGRFSGSRPTEYGYNAVDFQNTLGSGSALWYAFPIASDADPNAYAEVIRSGGVVNGGDQRRIAEGLAVALTIRCRVALRAPAPSEAGEAAFGSEEEAASSYNKELGMEDVHDPRTGENYWVSPSTDYHQLGPEGPGYYKQVGNLLTKLEPGRVD
jgi:hypothetical protein